MKKKLIEKVWCIRGEHGFYPVLGLAGSLQSTGSWTATFIDKKDAVAYARKYGYSGLGAKIVRVFLKEQ
jgi:hypothetical protein